MSFDQYVSHKVVLLIRCVEYSFFHAHLWLEAGGNYPL
jgi:hypothetical protein